MCDQKIKEFVDLALRNSKISYSDYEVTIDGNSNKGDGFVGLITFVTVVVTLQNGKQQTLDLVIKSAKESEKLRQSVPIKEAFYKEIFIYDDVITAFDTLQKEKKVENLVNIMPFCYATQVINKKECLIFENLKTQGYDLWNRRIPMTSKHIQLVLEAYGQWHALSFALKNQKYETFLKVTQDNINMMSYILKPMINSFIDTYLNTVHKLTAKNGKENFSVLNFSREDIIYFFNDMFFEEPDYHVILHGDCWNNNFMFKCLGDINNPTNVRILDWQCSGLAPPVFDLSHFIYSCSDTGAYRNVKELLKIYHNSLSECLKRLGNDPVKIYPYEKLIEHWKKFSKFGLVLSVMIIKGCLCEDNSLPDLEKTAEQDKEMSENFTFANVNEEAHYERVRNNFQNYIESLQM